QLELQHSGLHVEHVVGPLEADGLLPGHLARQIGRDAKAHAGVQERCEGASMEFNQRSVAGVGMMQIGGRSAHAHAVVEDTPNRSIVAECGNWCMHRSKLAVPEENV